MFQCKVEWVIEEILEKLRHDSILDDTTLRSCMTLYSTNTRERDLSWSGYVCHKCTEYIYSHLNYQKFIGHTC